MASYPIDISAIANAPGTSLDVRGTAQLDELDKGAEHIRLLGPVDVELTVENVGDGGFTARGRVSGRATLTCARCVEPFDVTLTAEVESMFRSRAVFGEDALPFEGCVLELGPVLEEALLLEVPFSPVCSPDCAGLCPACGADLSEDPCGCVIERGDPRLAVLKRWVDEHQD